MKKIILFTLSILLLVTSLFAQDSIDYESIEKRVLTKATIYHTDPYDYAFNFSNPFAFEPEEAYLLPFFGVFQWIDRTSLLAKPVLDWNLSNGELFPEYGDIFYLSLGEFKASLIDEIERYSVILCKDTYEYTTTLGAKSIVPKFELIDLLEEYDE